MNWFSVAARWSADQLGRVHAFIGAALLIVIWLGTGPLFEWSDTWQLICNTVTTIITFLAVFLLQHTQNRDMIAMQLKLDELVRAVGTASNKYVRIEDMTESELRRVRDRGAKARTHKRTRGAK